MTSGTRGIMHMDLNKQKESLKIKDQDTIILTNKKIFQRNGTSRSGKHNTWNENPKGSFISR